MTGYLLRRVLLALPLLIGAATLVFLLIHLTPGDPAQVMLGPGARPVDVDALRHRLGLDRPLLEQYGQFLTGLAHFNLGTSIRYQDAVTALLCERFPATAALAAATMLLALLVAMPAGIAAALEPGGAIDRMTAVWAAVALALPSFWLGPLLVLVFSIRLDWLPVSGMDAPEAIILPAATLAFGIGALVARLLRSTLVGEAAAVYVRAAQARGRGRVAAVLRHALRNAAGPVLTTVALQTGSLLTGAILTETIFAWPGLGRLMVRAISHRDYPLVQGCVLLFAMLYVGAHLVCDAARAALDPRLAD